MTTKTLQECIPEAETAYKRACTKALNCAGMYGYRKCTECRLYLTCQLQSNVKQRKINLDELVKKVELDKLNSKTNEKEN